MMVEVKQNPPSSQSRSSGKFSKEKGKVGDQTYQEENDEISKHTTQEPVYCLQYRPQDIPGEGTLDVLVDANKGYDFPDYF